jgi:hypothetical protein
MCAQPRKGDLSDAIEYIRDAIENKDIVDNGSTPNGHQAEVRQLGHDAIFGRADWAAVWAAVAAARQGTEDACAAATACR